MIKKKWCITFIFISGLATNASCADNCDYLSRDSITKARSRADINLLCSQFSSIRDSIQIPDNLPRLISKELKFNSCNILATGRESCNYWNPEYDNGQAISLATLYIIKNDAVISGGFASWNVNQEICVSPKAIENIIKNTAARHGLLPQDFFAEKSQGADINQYTLDNLNLSWGKVTLKYIKNSNCVRTIDVNWEK